MPEDNDIEFNAKQREFWQALFLPNGKVDLESDYDEFASWGGYGSGKTMVVLLAIFQMCQEYANLNIVVIRETYSQLDDTIIYDFNKMFGKVGYTHSIQQKTMKFPNKSTIKFRAFDQPEKILGGSIDVIVISQAEQIPEDLFIEIFGRQRGKSTLSKKILITEGNPSQCWAKTRYIDRQLPKNIFYIQSSTFDNQAFLEKYNPKYIQNMMDNYTESEIRSRVYGEWDSHELMVFSEFKAEVNMVEPFVPRPGMRDAIGGDYGYRNPAAFVWGLKDFNGNVIIYDEWYEREQSLDQIADAAYRHDKKIVVYDYSTKRPDRDGKSVWTELEKLGVGLIESNKDEIRNISVVNRMFKQGRLFITRNCVNLLKEIRNYHWKKLPIGANKNLEEKPQDKDNHAIDAMLYLIAFLEDLNSKDPANQPAGKRLIDAMMKPETLAWAERG